MEPTSEKPAASDIKRPVGQKKDQVMTTRIAVQMSLFLGIGVLLILLGASVAPLWPNIFQSIISKVLTLNPNSRSYENWKETPFPLYMRFYMFNWTNPHQVLKHQVKPHFTQMGPYVFRESRTKVNLTWNSNSTITFLNMRQWHFVPELSNGSLSDHVTNINVIAVTLASLVEKMVPKTWLPFINRMIGIEEPIYITKTVDELLFSGYHDPFLSLAARLKKFIKELNLPFDKFGWFYGRNMSRTYDGVFNMFTGETDFTRLGLLDSWNYSEQLKFFKGKCGKVQGTTGELWPVKTVAQNNATVFSNDLCSSLILDRGSTSIVPSGLQGVEFIGGPSVFSNESCYCINNNCHPYGVRDISTCRFGAPVFVSFPHFYLADPIYLHYVTGLSPNSSIHQFKITLDKETSVPLEVNARLQVNIYSQPVAMLTILNTSVPQAMFPMLWFEQHAVVEGELLKNLLLLNGLQTYGIPVFLSILGLGVILGTVGIFLSYRGGWRKHRTHILLTDETSQSSEVPSS